MRTKNYRIHVQQHYKVLEHHKAEGDKQAFYSVFAELIPQLKNYIKSRLQTLVHQGHFPHNFYEVNDFIDDLFIAVYENFESIHKEENFYMFLFFEIDRLIEKAQTTEDKHHESIENIENYTKIERDGLREQFTAAFDGDLIFKKDLDDISYDLNLQDISPLYQEDDERQIAETLDKEYQSRYTIKQIDDLLKKFPQEHRNVATLYIHFHLTAKEIVKVTKMHRVEVEKIIDAIKRKLRRDFFNM